MTSAWFEPLRYERVANTSPRLDRLSVLLRTSLPRHGRYAGGQGVFIKYASGPGHTLWTDDSVLKVVAVVDHTHSPGFVIVSAKDIANRAYEIYVDRGYADGFDRQDWLRAEHELKNPPLAERVFPRDAKRR